MKLALAQIRNMNGDLSRGWDRHLVMIRHAAQMGADQVYFPELSLIGYEPTLAAQLAPRVEALAWDDLDGLVDQHQLTVGLGAPWRTEQGLHIAMRIRQPQQAPFWYSKQYLHQDEEAWFTAASWHPGAWGQAPRIGLAICYEMSREAHLAALLPEGIDIYLASVAKHEAGMQAAVVRLEQVAKDHQIFTLIVNSLGPCDTFEAGGKSAIWGPGGRLLGQLDDAREGLLCLDTESMAVEHHYA
ncbi:MAG: carbon-nitrogen hydrolase family protein [Bacteroidota bacterium]